MTGKRDKWKRFAEHYNQFMERQGFLLVVGACVAVIVFTAVWTGSGARESISAPTLPPPSTQSASRLMQQSLEEAVQEETAPPTQKVASYAMPLDSIVMLQSFDDTTLRPSGTTGIYRMHDAVDLAAEKGQLVSAMAEGKVIWAQEKGLDRASVTIRSDNGVEITYSGMSALAGIEEGDWVEQGQTIGFVGEGPADEADMETHLHVRVVRNGRAIDPALLLNGKE